MMTYLQLVEPNINIGARAGMCLEYVDNAVNAPKRTATAQIAYETAKGNGWVSDNSEYPKNVWFVIFWSIDNNDYEGLGHIALAFVDSDGNMQIHDSEVHRGARQPYTSLAELSAWFGSVSTTLTYLGWSIGVDGVQIVGEIGQDEQKQLEEIGKEIKKANKGELSMFIAKCVGGDVNKYVKNGTFVLLKERGWDKSPQSQKEKSKLIQSILIVLVCFFSILCSTGYHQFSEINRHQS
jgi:hypothetical protein